MILNEVIKKLNVEVLNGSISEREIKGFSANSNEIREGYIFFAVPGVTRDGFDYTEEAIKKGAIAIVHSHRDKTVGKVVNLCTENVRRTYAEFSSIFYGEPSEKMHLVGITGTNGKTTTSFLVKSVFEMNNKKCGLIGTIFYDDGSNLKQSSLTTPDAADINRMLAGMLKNKVKNAVIEVSSHSLSQFRTSELGFNIRVFTNITQDHLDYHKTFDKYFNTKLSFFKNCTPETTSIINSDDKYSGKIIAQIRNNKSNLITFGINSGNVKITPQKVNIDGIKAKISYDNKESLINSPLIGYFNLYNICAAFTVGIAYGIPFEKITDGINKLKSVPGRVEKLEGGQPFTFILDYAHTPDAVEKVLHAVKPLAKRKIITVLGCGGDRDRTKRPLMGKIAKENSDLYILTTDNPRTEDPIRIIRDILKGIDKKTGIKVIPDRKQAIRTAIEFADKDDIIMLLGKGHEDYQIIGTKKYPFDDKKIALNYIKKYGNR